MNLNVSLEVFTEIDSCVKDIQGLDSYDPIIKTIKERFQQEIANHLTSLNSYGDFDAKEEIIKSSTSKGAGLGDTVEMQKEIYLNLGRKYSCSLFMFDMVDKPISISDIQLFYEILFSETEFRDTDEIFIINQEGEKISFANHKDIISQLSDLIDWYLIEEKEKKLHPIVIVSYFLHRFLLIHPFLDGNGRIARLLMNILFMKQGYLPILIAMDDRLDFYTSLVEADKGDLAPLVKFLSGKQLAIFKDFMTSPEYLSIVAKFEIETQLKDIKGTEKCFVLTEDSETGGLVELIFKASGFNIEETKFISYEGCSKIGSVILFSIFVKQKFPHIQIVIHRDRDYLTDQEIQKQRDEFSKIDVLFFVTGGTDIESYLVNPLHINKCHSNISELAAKQIIDTSINEVKPKSFDLLKKKEFGDKHKDKMTHLNLAIKEIFENDLFRFSHGKTLYKCVKSVIQKETKENAKLEVLTEHLYVPELNDIAKQIWQIK